MKSKAKQMKEAVAEQIIPLKCKDCGHKFDSNLHEWTWEHDTTGQPNREMNVILRCPPWCPVCNGIKTSPDMPDGEFSAMCKTLGIALIGEADEVTMGGGISPQFKNGVE